MRRFIFGCAAFLSLLTSSFACTAFQLKSQDNSLIYCRSMEFGFPVDSDLLIVPRNTNFIGSAPDNRSGLHWKSTYGYVGMNIFLDRRIVTDGMNEKGLVVGCLYLPGYAQYEEPEPAHYGQMLGPWELTSYLLGACATVTEAKAALKQIIVVQEKTPQLGNFILPLHYYICDASGSSIVVEFVNGVRHEYDNPLGVLTNSPPFEWHLANLGNYVNLSPVNVPELSLGNWNIENFGQGSGMLGLPGDSTAPSRFVRAAFFSQWCVQPKTASDGVRLGFHILNTFDIFEGLIRSRTEHAPILSARAKLRLPIHSSDITEWVVVHDRTHLKTYLRNYFSLQIEMVDLTKINFEKSGFSQIPMNCEFEFQEITDQAKPLSH